MGQTQRYLGSVRVGLGSAQGAREDGEGHGLGKSSDVALLAVHERPQNMRVAHLGIVPGGHGLIEPQGGGSSSGSSLLDVAHRVTITRKRAEGTVGP